MLVKVESSVLVKVESSVLAPLRHYVICLLFALVLYGCLHM